MKTDKEIRDLVTYYINDCFNEKPPSKLSIVEGILYLIKGIQEDMYTREDLMKAIKMAREVSEGKEHFTIEDISGLTAVCTYDWEERFSQEEIIKFLKPQV